MHVSYWIGLVFIFSVWCHPQNTPTHTHTYIHTYIQTYIHTNIHTYDHSYIHTYYSFSLCLSLSLSLTLTQTLSLIPSGTGEDNFVPYLVLEFCARGALDEILHTAEIDLSWSRRLGFAKDAARVSGIMRNRIHVLSSLCLCLLVPVSCACGWWVHIHLIIFFP